MADAQDTVRRRHLSRRGFLAGIAATAGSAILAACGGSSSPTATTAPTAAATRAAGSAAAPTTAASAAPTTAAAAPTTAAASAAAATSPASSAASGTSAPSTSGGTTVITAPSPAASAGKPGGQVNVYWTKPVTLHPLFSTAGIEQGAERQMFGALVRMNDKLDAVPDLAESIEVSADAKVYTFHLKKGLKFSDGSPLTAKDVIFTYERAVDKRVASYWRGRLLALDGATEFGDQKAPSIKGLEAPDDSTIKMTLATPDSTWLLTIGDFAGLAILPKSILESTPPDQMAKAPFSFAPTPSSGAFLFDEWKADQYLAIKRNDGYTAGPKALLDKIFLKVLTQQDVGIAQLERGEIDLMVLPVTEADRLKKNPNLTITSTPAPSVSFFALNFSRPYFKDKRVRQGLQYSLDREAMVKSILSGEGRVVQSTIIGPDWMGIPDGLTEYKYDPNKAKQLLKDGGWDPSWKIQLKYTPGDKINDAVLPIVQQQFKDVGVNMELLTVAANSWNIVTDATPDKPADFDIAIIGGGVFGEDPNVSAKYFETASFTPAGGNYGHYSNPQLDDLFKQGRGTPDRAKRKQIYTQLAKILNEEVPWIYLWSPNSIHGLQKRLKGFKPPSYATHIVWNAEEWYVQ